MEKEPSHAPEPANEDLFRVIDDLPADLADSAAELDAWLNLKTTTGALSAGASFLSSRDTLVGCHNCSTSACSSSTYMGARSNRWDGEGAVCVRGAPFAAVQ